MPILKPSELAKRPGWIDSPGDVARVVAGLPIPVFMSSDPAGITTDKDVLLYEAVRKVTGKGDYTWAKEAARSALEEP